MSKSLTEAAKAVLMGEENYPSVDSMGAGHPDRDAKSMTSNAATLKPNSKGSEGRFSNPNATEPEAPENGVQDLGPAVVKPTDKNGIFGVAEKIKKTAKRMADKEGGEMSSKKVMAEDEEAEDENLVSEEEVAEEDAEVVAEESDVELSEEMEEFIDKMIEEGATEEEIMAALEENFELVSEEAEEVEEEVEPIEALEVDLDEAVDALFEGEELSEEFKEKAKTIFEAALNEKLKTEIAILEQAYAESLEEEVAQIQEALTENVDGYLNYVVEQWVTDNEVAIESGLRSELTEDFISGLKALFEEHYIDIPEDKVSIVEGLQEQVDELEAKLNEEIDRNVELTKVINESKAYEIVAEACEGLTATQAAKLQSLAENVDFTDDASFAKKVATLKESYFSTEVKNDNVLTEEVLEEDATENLNGPMKAYVRSLGKTQPK
jgi:hypothetical protein